MDSLMLLEWGYEKIRLPSHEIDAQHRLDNRLLELRNNGHHDNDHECDFYRRLLTWMGENANMVGKFLKELPICGSPQC